MPMEIRTHHYGPLPSQAGELYLPSGSHLPVVCLLHGGYWRLPHGRDQFDVVAQDLAASGFAVWNVSFNTCCAPATIGFVTVIVHSVPAAVGNAQSVVPFVIAVNVVFCGTTS